MLSHVSNEAIRSSKVHMPGMLRDTSGTFLFNSKQVLEKYWHALFKVASANFRVTPGREPWFSTLSQPCCRSNPPQPARKTASSHNKIYKYLLLQELERHWLVRTIKPSKIYTSPFSWFRLRANIQSWKSRPGLHSKSSLLPTIMSDK